MFQLRIFVYLFSAAALLGLGFFVLLNNAKARVNRWLFAFILSVVAWILTLNFADNYNNLNLATLSSHIAFGVAAITMLCLYQFSRYFPKELMKKGRIPGMILSVLVIFLVIISPTKLAVESVQLADYGAEVTGGPFYILLLLTGLFSLAFTGRNLWLNWRTAGSLERQQLRFFSYGLGAMALVIVLTNLVLVLVGISSLGFLGPPSVLLFVVPTVYAIVRHRLFDIRAVVARSVAYIFSVAAFAFLYAFLAFGLAQGVILKNILTTELSQQVFNVVLAVLLAFTFPTIRRFFEKITDRIFYRDRYDPQVLVSDIGRVLASEIELDKLSIKVLEILQSQMRLDTTNIVVTNKDGIFYQTHSSKIQQLYHPDDLKKFKVKPTITDEIASGEKRDILDRHNVRAIFPLKTTESFVGYLLLGEKKSGDIFSEQDIQTLQIIANELAVAIQNARSYTEIQRFNETLREKIRQATADLTHANHELKALDKAKDEFISMASHQLRTPLTAVRGYTSMVMDGDFGRISKEQKETLKQSFDAATRMTRLVDDLLNVSRIQSGKFRIERAPVDLKKVLPEELALLETTASTKNVTLQYHEPKGDIPTLSIDEGKTRQCLMNMMDNAIYYSSTGKEPGKVDIYLETDGQTVTFKVVDNGIGVPKSEQAKLFKKFYRAPNAQQARPDGTGLGLFLVGRVVHDQGGEIIFESTEGKGSTFGFKLPVKPTGEGVEAETKSPAATPKTSSPQA
ncbi:MAG: GAF domain-containing sensor histidine kinase [Candidatus Saccharibacteria bacterium]